MAKSNPFKHKRPPTIWVDESTFCDEQLNPHPASYNLASAPDQTTATAFTPSNKVNLQQELPNSGIRQLSQDPWSTFETIAEIFHDRSLLLARHKRERERLVYIQKLEQGSFSTPTLLDLMNQISHSSFLALQELYLHVGVAFLIWEPVEVSVGQILASKCMITASEVVGIVQPVLEGIQYLSDRGRVLATLSVETVFLTDSGNVKIVGVENSCQIKPSEMNPATLKLYALADIVVKLMGKNTSSHEWSAEIQKLPRQLESLSLGELLKNKTFKRASCPGELKLLVNLTNKTAYHRVDAYSYRL